MPSVTTGPVGRVWYSEDGSALYAQTVSGRIFATTDFEQWKQVQGQSVTPPAPTNPEAVTFPEAGLKIRSQRGGSSRFYGAGRNAYRSDDGGVTWTNLTAYKGASILGGGLADLAVSPREPDEAVVTANTGVRRPIDGGWHQGGQRGAAQAVFRARIARIRTAATAGASGRRIAQPTPPALLPAHAGRLAGHVARRWNWPATAS